MLGLFIYLSLQSYNVTSHKIISGYLFKLTLLWGIETRFQTVEELVKAQLPVGVLVGELNEGINTETPGGNEQKQHKMSICSQTVTTKLRRNLLTIIC